MAVQGKTMECSLHPLLNLCQDCEMQSVCRDDYGGCQGEMVVAIPVGLQEEVTHVYSTITFGEIRGKLL